MSTIFTVARSASIADVTPTLGNVYALVEHRLDRDRDPFLLSAADIQQHTEGMYYERYFLPLIGTPHAVAVAEHIRRNSFSLLTKAEVVAFFDRDFPHWDNSHSWVDAIRAALRIRVADWWIRNAEDSCMAICAVHGFLYYTSLRNRPAGYDPWSGPSLDETALSERDAFLSDYLNRELYERTMGKHMPLALHHLRLLLG